MTPGSRVGDAGAARGRGVLSERASRRVLRAMSHRVGRELRPGIVCIPVEVLSHVTELSWEERPPARCRGLPARRLSGLLQGQLRWRPVSQIWSQDRRPRRGARRCVGEFGRRRSHHRADRAGARREEDRPQLRWKDRFCLQCREDRGSREHRGPGRSPQDAGHVSQGEGPHRGPHRLPRQPRVQPGTVRAPRGGHSAVAHCPRDRRRATHLCRAGRGVPHRTRARGVPQQGAQRHDPLRGSLGHQPSCR
jgi:hypothetical protein